MNGYCYNGSDRSGMQISGMRLLTMFLLMVVLFLASDLALAGAATGTTTFNGSALANGLSSLVGVLNGPVARSLAVLAVIGMGIMALTGRVEWSRAVVVVLGVGLIFSAGALIDLLFPPATN